MNTTFYFAEPDDRRRAELVASRLRRADEIAHLYITWNAKYGPCLDLSQARCKARQWLATVEDGGDK